MEPSAPGSQAAGTVVGAVAELRSGQAGPVLAAPLCRFHDLLGVAAADQLLQQLIEGLGADNGREPGGIDGLADAVGRRAGVVCDLLGVQPPASPRLSFALVTGDDRGRPSAEVSVDPAGATDSACVSFIYWLHARPRRFSGGQLRLYDVGIGNGQPIIDAGYRDCPVEHDTIMFFPSSFWSELRPVTRPVELQPVHGAADDPAGARFALRGWIR
ncbi:2OG-Fe(II) oxygenase [Nocardia sp. XZ_19_369]|uniref:2OG-Fe(II) oxygenase n=1 Tax=Nocardia sp. XZ_19_369 TaxID=2769487 RepID=UPI001890B619|nr:2OG-Fe(II) oxygenase [Nocardia sp. XZ_19_369]